MKDSMTRPKIAALIVAGALAAAGVGFFVFKKNETAAPQTSGPKAQDRDTERSADTSATQIEQVPRQSQDVFMPPASNATGSSPPPAPAPKSN